MYSVSQVSEIQENMSLLRVYHVHTIDVDPVCREDPPLTPTRRETGVAFYSVLFLQHMMLSQVPPLGRGGSVLQDL
jgi:hypothetical protein